MLGEDHPDTQALVNNLALNLRQLGDYERARQLNEDTQFAALNRQIHRWITTMHQSAFTIARPHRSRLLRTEKAAFQAVAYM
jgi:hypothetical protein